MEFQILAEAGVPFPAIHLLSNHYNLTRSEYYRRLDESSRSGGDVIPFVFYAVRGFLDGLRGAIAQIRRQHLETTWNQLVQDRFAGAGSPSSQRRRSLALALAMLERPIPRAQITSMRAGLARAYAGRTERTLTRDLNELVAMGLASKTPEGWAARMEIVQAFVPPKIPSGP